MSWIEKSNYDMRVRTGDGSEFDLLWMRAVKTKEFNIAEFNFPGVAGTLVSRGTPKGRKYNVEMYFQGRDHLDFAAAFDDGSDDPRPWQIIHPYYGTLIVQPVSLNYDNTSHNVTKVTGTLIETITEDRPKVTIDPPDQIANLANNVFDFSAISVSSKIRPLTLKNVDTLRKNTTNIFNVGRKSIFDTITFEDYFNLYNQALTDINNATANPLAAIRAVQAMINAPFNFAANVKVRIDSLIAQFDILIRSLANLNGLNDKRIFENNASNIISSMTLSSVTNATYDNRDEVVYVTEAIMDTYNSLVTYLDGLQTESGEEESYHPDIDSMMALYNLVNYTTANLFNVAVDSRQQRSIITDEDSNPILLTHRFYGMNEGDENLVKFIKDNNIGLSEILQIKKGRRVIYYL